MNNGIENILAVLNPDNTMSINRPLAHAIGMNETIVYAALISKYSYYLATCSCFCSISLLAGR